MANSFALTDGGVVLQQPTQAVTGPQLTLQGGGGNPPPVATPGLAPGGEFQQFAQEATDLTNKALGALNQMTQGALGPYVEAQQKKSYFDGMSQVVQGRALQDIQREQPWYTKIFGPSATVQGAQAMTATTALSQAQSEFMAAMPELRKQGPDAMRQYLVDQAVRIGNTGDVLVDGIVQQKLAEQWPTMLGTHMKQHYAWQQEDMGEKFVTMQIANGKLLQETLAQQKGFADKPEQRALEVMKFTDGLARPAGMDDNAYGKYMNLAAKSQLHQGNFAAYEAMKAIPEVWQAISPEAQQSLIDSEEKWAAVALRDAPALTDITTNEAHFRSAIQQGRFDNEAQLHAIINKFNADFKAGTGSSSDMINNAERAQLVQQFHKARAAQAASWAKIQQGVADDQAQRTNVERAYHSGDPAMLSPGVSEVNARGMMEEIGQAVLGNPDVLDEGIGKLALASYESKLRIPTWETRFKQDVDLLFTGGGNITERQRGSLALMQKFLTVPGGGAYALANYVGADRAAKVEALLDSGVSLDDPKALVDTLKTIKDGAGAHTTRADVDAAKRYINSQDTSWYQLFTHGALDGLDLNDASKEWMAENLAPAVAREWRANPSLSRESAAKYAFDKTFGTPNAGEFVDGAFVPMSPRQSGAGTLFSAVQELAGYPIGHTNPDYQRAVRDVLRDTLKGNVAREIDGQNKVGEASIGNPHKADIEHFRDGDWEAVSGDRMPGKLGVYYQNKESGRRVMVIVTPEQVLGRYKQNMKRDYTRREENTLIVTPTPGGAATAYRRSRRPSGD